MIEFRLHGRGGQALSTWAEVLALAALRQDHYAQTYQSFGLDRPGAPNTAITRVDDAFILTRSGMGSAPDIVVVLDGTLTSSVNVTAGLRPGGTVVGPSGALPQTAEHSVGVETGGLSPVAARAAVVAAAAATSGRIALTSLQTAARELGFTEIAEAIEKGYKATQGGD